ncbi:LacI family transcriptional regulator [Microbacterium sp. CFH 90308]|uniref:LacI family transcriptional regulator n=1 Tax=Microbacterium salsuginis TaxID=2722803 RepID=A0ABX1KE61_9MICO|nr:LacI family DNA-binding transcriptional regulator [Microbacterium sp. CFH 90308]NLP85189.1 LacI family transcriptional regulator [Microbacterium sp. CFH 90308]
MNEDEAIAAKPRRATVADVAVRSGVSRATVSYVLNDVAGQTIPEKTKNRVRAAALELGYVPSAAAASLRRGHSRIVLLVTDSSLAGFVTQPFLTAIAERLIEGGYVPVTHQFATNDALRALVSEIRPFGVLALTALSPELLNAFREAGVPNVYSSTHGDPTFPRPWEEEIGQLQADVLIDGGAQHLIYAAPRRDNPRRVMANARELGASRSAADHGLATPTHISLGFDLDRAIEAFRSAIDADRIFGVCAFDDEIAGVALAAVQRLGLRVPDQVRVIGVDDAPFAAFFTPPLTTIAIDGHNTGWTLADRFLNGKTDRENISHALASLIRRETA